jgi:hypothetical protein
LNRSFRRSYARERDDHLSEFWLQAGSGLTKREPAHENERIEKLRIKRSEF